MNNSAVPKKAYLFLAAIVGLGVFIFFTKMSDHRAELPDKTLLVTTMPLTINYAPKRCDITLESRIVRGDSLTGLVSPGEEITMLRGYYICHEVERGDVIVYQYAGNHNPLIKVVRGVPGDSFHIIATMDSSAVMINGIILKTFSGEAYRLDSRASTLLSLYEHDYYGIIPANSYLILGNVSTGSLDSTRFGLVDKSDIVGKVKL